MSTRVLTAHIPEELAEKVDGYAKSMDRSRAWIVKQALAGWIYKEEERHRLTMEGLADIDAGRVVDDERVKEWIDSLDTDHPLPVPQSGK